MISQDQVSSLCFVCVLCGRMSGGIAATIRGALFGASAGLGAVTVINSESPFSGLANVVTSIRSVAGPGMTNHNAEVVALIKPLSDQVLSLTNEVSRMRLQQSYPPYYARGSSWLSVISVGGVCVLVLYGFGFSFNDFMYVTKKALSVAVAALEQGIENLGTALENAKRELSYKVGLVEEKVDETRESLEEKIASEVGDVKRELSLVGEDVKSVAKTQEDVQDMVQGLETQFKYLENQMEGASDQLSNANTGISLLCKAVVSTMSVSQGDTGHIPEDSRSIYEKLVRFTENTLEPVRSTFSFGYRKKIPNPTEPQGLHVLVPLEDSQGNV